MIGLISINFINDTKTINTYPVIMYYNGDKNNIVSSIKKELSQFIYNNCVSLDMYGKTKMFVVTYCTADATTDSEETTEKYVYNIEDLYNLSEYDDIKTKILNEALQDFANINDDYVSIIRQLITNNVSMMTIKHYVRHRVQEVDISEDNITVLMKTFNETYERTNNN
jgi:hypothetical protein